MKKVILFLSFCISLSSVFAQTTKEDEEQIARDSIQLIENFNKNSLRNCPTPLILSEAVVRYKQNALVYYKFDGNVRERRFSVRSNETEQKAEISLNENEIIINNLPLEGTFDLITTNDCDEDVVISNFSTSNGDIKNITASSQELFDLVTDWAANKNENKRSIEEVFSESRINKYEKLAFFQDFFLNDTPIDQSDEGDVLNGAGGTTKTDCKCKILEFIPRSISSTNDDGQNLLVKAGPDDKDDNGRVQWTYTQAYKGPAKKLVYEGLGKRLSGNFSDTKGVQSNTSALTSPNMAMIQYALICVGNYNDPSADCQCERELAIHYRYQTRLDVKTDKGTCWLCRTKEAKATAEDWAAFVVEKNGVLKVADVKGALLAGKCEMAVNKDFIVGVIGIAATIGATIATSGAAGPLITALEPQVKALAKGEVFDVNDCESGSLDKTLLAGTETVTLKPGEKVITRLYGRNLDL